MRAVPFDTMEYMQELRNGGMTQDEAEALTKATAKAFEKAMDDKNVATKNDLKQLELNLKNDVHKLELSLKNDLNKLDLSLKSDLKDLEIRVVKSQNEIMWKMLGFMSAIQILSLGLYTFAQHFITKVT